MSLRSFVVRQRKLEIILTTLFKLPFSFLAVLLQRGIWSYCTRKATRDIPGSSGKTASGKVRGMHLQVEMTLKGI